MGTEGACRGQWSAVRNHWEESLCSRKGEELEERSRRLQEEIEGGTEWKF